MLKAINMSQPPSRLMLLPFLPEELIREILFRVPVRSLLEFKCVCKSWKTLISNLQFGKDHFHTSSSSIASMTHQRLVSLTNDDWKEITTCSVQSLFEHPIAPPKTSSFRVERRWLFIIGSCNGLLCLSDDFGFFKLRNPFTRLASKRSPPIIDVDQHVITRYGFGYDQVNDKYKVLITYEFPKQTKIHTFGTNSWKRIQTFPSCAPPLQWLDKVGNFLCGTLNWLVRERDRIISFDLKNETYGEVLLPDHMDGDFPCNLDVLNNCLCLCCFNDIHCVVWLMKKYGIQESWTKLILIPRRKIPTLINTPFRLRPLCTSENGVVLVESNDLQLVMYNTKADMLDYPKFMGKYLRIMYRHYIHIYHESLISPL